MNIAEGTPSILGEAKGRAGSRYFVGMTKLSVLS